MAAQDDVKQECLPGGWDASELAEYGHWQRIERLVSTVLWPLGLCACVVLFAYCACCCGVIDSHAGCPAAICAAICHVYFFCFLANFKPGKKTGIVMLALSFAVLLALLHGLIWPPEDEDAKRTVAACEIVFGSLFLAPPLFASFFSLWNKLAGRRFARKTPERRAKKMKRMRNVLARKIDAFLERHPSLTLSSPKEFVLLSYGWTVVVVGALLLLLTAYFYIGGIEWGDWTIPDEKELRLELRDVPDKDNAYLALMALTNVYTVTQGDYGSTKISDKSFVRYYGNQFFTDGDNDERGEWAAVRRDSASLKRAEKILADHAKFFEALRAALSLKGFLADFDEEVRTIWPNEDFKPGISHFGTLKPFIDFAQLVGLKAQVALECGDSETAVSAVSDIHALGQMVAINCGYVCFGDIYSGYVEWCVGNLIKGIAYKKMIDAIAMGKATDEMFEAFNKMVDEDEAVAVANRKRVIKAEFTYNARCVDWYSRSYSPELLWGIIDFNEHDVNISTRCEFDHLFGRKKSWNDRFAMFKIRAKMVAGLMLLHWPCCKRYILHRRETLFRIAERARAAIAGEELRGSSAGQATLPFSYNAFGSFLVYGMCNLCSATGTRASEYSLARTRIRLILASEKWRRAHGGENPPTLEALVPDYLAAVPADPWDKTGAPLKYDAASGVAWSVGRRGTYDYLKVAKDRTAGSESSLDDDTQTYAFRIDGKPIISSLALKTAKGHFPSVATNSSVAKDQQMKVVHVVSLEDDSEHAASEGEGKIDLSHDGGSSVSYDAKVRRPWLVPVTSCRSAMKGRYGSAVFVAGLERGLAEGAVISPGVGKCGYRVLSISDRCVWFEAFYSDAPPENEFPHGVWPDFSRIDTMPQAPAQGRLILGNRHFWPGEAIKLPNSSYCLVVDHLLKGKGAVFRLLDSSMRPVRDLLCVIVREQ